MKDNGNKMPAGATPLSDADQELLAEMDKAIAPYAKGLDGNNEILWAESIVFLKRAQDDIFEAGRRFMVLKERIGHGNFIKEVERRGLNINRVGELMVITRKFANSRALGNLGKAKLLTLSRATDEEIQQLEETGRIWDIPQDELAGKSDREIKEAYKRERAKNLRTDAKLQRGQEQIEAADKKISKLEKDLKEAKNPPQLTEQDILRKLCSWRIRLGGLLMELETMKIDGSSATANEFLGTLEWARREINVAVLEGNCRALEVARKLNLTDLDLVEQIDWDIWTGPVDRDQNKGQGAHVRELKHDPAGHRAPLDVPNIEDLLKNAQGRSVVVDN